MIKLILSTLANRRKGWTSYFCFNYFMRSWTHPEYLRISCLYQMLPNHERKSSFPFQGPISMNDPLVKASKLCVIR